MAGHLNDNCLILNRHYCAVDISAARDVFGKLYNDQARVLVDFQPFSYNEWRTLSYGYEGPDVIGCVGYKLRVPEVVLLLKYDRMPRKEVRYTRNSVFERDRHTCCYCGQKFPEKLLNLDHVIPREQGGGTSWENIATSCISCNTRKANFRPDQCGMRLLKKPTKPHWRPMVSVKIERIMRPSWEPFLDAATWDVEVSGHKQAVLV